MASTIRGSARRASCVVLIVDDHEPNRRLIMGALQPEGYTLLEAVDGRDAQRVLREQPVDVVVTDVVMPHMDGLSLLGWAQQQWPDGNGPIWIIHSALDTFAAAVQALQRGAFDFVAKPLQSIRLMQRSVRNAAEHRVLLAERERLHRELADANAALAAHVDQLEDVCRMLREQATVIQLDMSRAELIQRALLPEQPPAMPGFAVDTVYRPSKLIGGDVYDIVRLDDRHIAMYVADAAGHGVASAMLSVLLKHRLTMMDAATNAPVPPAKVLASLNRALHDECAAPGLFVTIAYGVLDLFSHELVVASAGHPPLALHLAGGEVTMLERTGPALGLEVEAKYGELSFSFDQGDQLLFYTDGLFEGAGDATSLTPDAVARALATDADGGQHLLHALLDASTAQQGGASDDDVTMLLLTATDARSTLDHGTTATAGNLSHAPTPSPTPPAGSELAVGHGDDATWVAVRGRGRWIEATRFFQLCCDALRSDRNVVVDLSSCTYLDSTFLGTLHELAADAQHHALRIAGVGPEVAQLFEELAMDRVRQHVTTEALTAPPMRAVAVTPPEREGQRRILRAHELLAALSASNHAQFQGVVDAMRADLGTTAGS